MAISLRGTCFHPANGHTHNDWRDFIPESCFCLICKYCSIFSSLSYSLLFFSPSPNHLVQFGYFILVRHKTSLSGGMCHTLPQGYSPLLQHKLILYEVIKIGLVDLLILTAIQFYYLINSLFFYFSNKTIFQNVFVLSIQNRL